MPPRTTEPKHKRVGQFGDVAVCKRRDSQLVFAQTRKGVTCLDCIRKLTDPIATAKWRARQRREIAAKRAYFHNHA
jgi:ribosomal protein S27E